MTTLKAVLFDLGGTLTEAEKMTEAIEWALRRAAGLSDCAADRGERAGTQ